MKCFYCGKQKGEHQAKTLACPFGRKSRVGYLDYSCVTSYKPKEVARG